MRRYLHVNSQNYFVEIIYKLTTDTDSQGEKSDS